MSTVIDLETLGSQGFVAIGDPSDRTGWSVSGAGDINGDGYDDIVIGVPQSGAGGQSGGKAYVIFGGPEGFGTIDLTNLQAADGFSIEAASPADQAGISVSDAGDVNGDGFDDLLVGATPGSGYGGVGTGYVIFGKASPTAIDLANLASSDGFTVHGESHYYSPGAVGLSSAGDINGDGFDDIIVGAIYDNYTSGPFYGSYSGAAYVVFGKASGFTTLNLPEIAGSDGFEIVGPASSYAGQSVSGAGDINGDGFDDIIVGVPYGSKGGAYAGEAYVIFGKASGFGKIDLSNLAAGAGFLVQGDMAGDNAAFSVSGAGDFNGDGYDDIVIGAPYGDDGGTDAGEAYVIFGKAGSFGTIDLSNIAATAGFIIKGEDTGDHAGWSVSAAGDVNHDGYDDIIIGAPGNDNTRDGAARSIDAGEAYVIFGRATGFATIDLANLSPSDGFLIQGEAAYDVAGSSVSGAGDVDGDGFDDLLIGAPSSGRGGYRAGATYIVSGRLDPAPVGQADFNGDGRDDVLLRNDNGWATDWLGQLNGSFLDNGAASSRWAHPDWQVAGSGDFNGDNRDDLILRHDNGWMTEWLGQVNGSFSDNGAVASGWIHPDWQIAGTGDFNGDTRDDLMLRNGSGTMVEWLGQANGSFAANAAAGAWAHPYWHVEATGDFNGDGRDDLLLRHADGWMTEWLAQPNGSFSDNGTLAKAWIHPDWQVAATGDFNGDHRDDLVLRHADGTIVEWLGQPNGSFAANGAATKSLPTAWSVVNAGDFNGDTRDDLLLRHADGTFVEWLSQANGSFLANNAATNWAHPTWHVQPAADAFF